MKMHKILFYAGVLIGAGLLTSCRTPSSGIVVESHPKTTITVNSTMVGRRIQVVDCNVAKRDNLLQAQITAQNITQKDVQFEYRYRWTNKEGQAVDSGMSTWIPISMSAMEKQLLSAIAPNKEAEDFIFEIRFSRPSTRW